MHAQTAHRRRVRATAGRARACCCCCCCCCCRWHAPSPPASAATPIPLWRTPTSRGHIRAHTGARTPSCPRSLRRRAHTTSGLARSLLPSLGQTIRSFLSASREDDAQRAAKHGQQAK
eukprot:4235522-Prymnesium_polylepis.1